MDANRYVKSKMERKKTDPSVSKNCHIYASFKGFVLMFKWLLKASHLGCMTAKLFLQQTCVFNYHTIFVCYYVIFNRDQWSIRKNRTERSKKAAEEQLNVQTEMGGSERGEL